MVTVISLTLHFHFLSLCLQPRLIKTNKVNLSEQYAQSEFLPKAKSPPPSW